MATNDFRSVGAVLADEYLLEWPQSKERIWGRANFAAMNEEYPAHGRWRFTINRIVGNETDVVTDVDVTDGVQHARAIIVLYHRGWENHSARGVLAGGLPRSAQSKAPRGKNGIAV